MITLQMLNTMLDAVHDGRCDDLEEPLERLINEYSKMSNMGQMKEIQIEIDNSKALSYFKHQIDLMQVKLAEHLQLKECPCGKKVLVSEYIVVYPDSDKEINGVCNTCYMHKYLPYTEEFSPRPNHAEGEHHPLFDPHELD